MPHLLTGNRLLSGEVIWWTGEGWSLHIREAVVLEKAQAEALIEQHRPGEAISDLAAIEVEPTDAGWLPRTTRERVRAIGPSVRPDFALPSLPPEVI